MAFKTLDKTSEFIRECLAAGDTAPPISAFTGLKQNEFGGLRRLEQYADDNMIPVLLPESAAFLKQICMLVAPKKVLEIGMGIGYSGHIILLNSPAHLYTIEHNDEFVDTAAMFFNNSKLLERVTFLRGDESDIIPMIDGNYDMIFLDGAKTRYCHHLPYLKKLLNKGGVLLADNVLFNGMVTGEKKAGKKHTIVDGLRLFLKNLCADSDFTTSILPVGDGMSLSIKIV